MLILIYLKRTNIYEMTEEEGYFSEIADSENLATEAQIRKIYALLHRLGIDPRDFKEERGFTNYAKLTRRQASEMIDELERREMVQIEEKLKADARQTAEHAEITETATSQRTTAATAAEGEGVGAGEGVEVEAGVEVEVEEKKAKKAAEEEVARAARLMRMCVGEAKRIVEEEMPFVVSEAIKAKTIGSIAATLFIQLESRSHRWVNELHSASMQ
ncbi:MAG: hypothetical protein OCU22_05395 [Canidatus Methanoxibalbensis ujae]|nr:hypothetical protein [Candidatus Methanoxibalbensis ujae]